ncbi:hypothetical protein GQ53DRAFT_767187 [Thozetella sp. PMI_491]|nr:hypothetical protein GQ53DRAFT_767187 [Thozetella sp. PMI_491]
MKGAFHLVLAGFASLTLAEVLDLGQLDQYNPRLDALNGCGDELNKCYQEVHKLEKRAFVEMISKSIKSWVDVFVYISNYLRERFHMIQEEVQELGLFLPATAMAEASGLAEATAVVVSANGTEAGTITPIPDATTLQGSETPSVVPVTAASGQFLAGDLMMLMDDDLTQRLDEVMHRMMECEDGIEFDRQHPTQKRAGTTIGQALCGAIGTAGTLREGGPLNDMLYINTGHVRISFRDATAAVAQAADVLAQFILANAPLIGVPDGLLDQLPAILMTLAVETIMNGNPIRGKNRIASSLITTSLITTSLITTSLITTSVVTTSATPTSTSTGCPAPTATRLLCGFENEDCKINPSGTGANTTCAEGPYENCQCLSPGGQYVSPISGPELQSVIAVCDLLRRVPGPPGLQPPPSGGPRPDCKKDQLSNIPKNVFGGDNTDVYHAFCEKWAASQELKMTLDASGNDRSAKRRIRGRTPPPDPSTWSHYNFLLGFKPTDGTKKCSLDCKAAYSLISNSCSSTGSKGVLMAVTGKIDVDCGVFDYQIEGPMVEPKFIDRECFKADEFGTHPDVSEDWQRYTAYAVCDFRDGYVIKRSDPSTNLQKNWPSGVKGGSNITYNIYWKDGCQYDFPGRDEMNPFNPLGGPGAGDEKSCFDPLVEDFLKCDNHGTGGVAQIGCLMYEFKVLAE